MDILCALEALRNAPDDLLYAHSKEAVLTIREMEHRLEKMVAPTDSRPTVKSRCHFCQRQPLNNEEALVQQSESSTSASRRNSDSVPSTSGEQQDQIAILPRPRRFSGAQKPTLLFASLMKEVPWVWDFIQKKPNEVIQAHRKQEPIDIRLQDIQRVDGNANPTNKDRLFRGVAQRSLALQFSKFKSGFPETKRSRREGLIPTFVRDRLHVPNQQFAKQCVQAGQKQLETENALRNALGQEDTPFAGTGVSVLTALAITPFKNLRLGQIPPFIDQFFMDSARIDLPLRQSATDSRGPVKRSFHVLKILEHISKWLNEFQNYYDEIIQTERPSSTQPVPGNNTTRDPPFEEATELISPTNSDRVNGGRHVSLPSSHQPQHAGENTSASGSLTEQDSSAGFLLEPSPPTQSTDCTTLSGHGVTQQGEPPFARSALTGGGYGNTSVTDHRALARNMSPTSTDHTQWANVALDNFPTGCAVDSNPAGLSISDALLRPDSTQEASEARRKRRRTQTAKDAMAMQFGPSPFSADTFASHDTFNPRQYGQPTISLSEPMAQNAITMQFGHSPISADTFAVLDAFNPRQYGQPTISIAEPTAQDAISMHFGHSPVSTDTFAALDAFNPQQYGQPTVSIGEPTAQDAMQFGHSPFSADTFASHDAFNPRQYGQPPVSIGQPMVQDIFDSQQFGQRAFPTDGSSMLNALNLRDGQLVIS